MAMNKELPLAMAWASLQVSVIVKRPVLPPCVVDGRSRHPLSNYYIIYYMAAAVSARYVYTIQPRTMSLHAKYLHISPPLVLEEGFIDLNCELYLFEL